MTRPPPISTLFPYPTLSRSARRDRERGHDSSQNQKEIDPNRRCGDTELDQRPWLRVDESSGRRWPAAIGPQREALKDEARPADPTGDVALCDREPRERQDRCFELLAAVGGPVGAPERNRFDVE